MADMNANIIIRLKDMASAGLGTIRRSLADFGQQMNVAKTNAEAFQKKMEGIGAFGRTLAIGAGVVAGGIGLIGKSALTAAGELEQNRVAFKAMLGSYSEADRILGRITQIAAKTQFEAAPLTTMTQQLTVMTKDGDKALDILLSIGDAIATSGKGAFEMQRFVENFQQVSSKNMIDAKDTKEFANALPIFRQILAESNLTAESIQNSANGVELLTQALKKASQQGGSTYKGLENQSKTALGLQSTLSDNVKIFIRDIGTASLTVVKPILQVMITLTNFLQNLSPITKATIGLIGGLVFVVASLATGIGLVAALAPRFSAGMEMMGLSSLTFAGALNLVGRAAAWGLIIYGLVTVSKYIYEHRKAVLDFVEAHKKLFIAIGVIAGIIASAYALKNAMKIMELAMLAIRPAIAGFSAVFSTIPIVGWIGAIVSAGIGLYSFRKEIQSFGESIVLKFINPIKSAILAIQSWIDAYNRFAKAVPGIPAVNIDITPAIKKLDELEKKHKTTKKELGGGPNIKPPTVPQLQQLGGSDTQKDKQAEKDKLAEEARKKRADALLTALSQEVEMRKIYGDITLQQERDKYAELLRNTEFDEQQRLQIRQKMFELDKEIGKQKLENDQYLWSEEQKMLFDREQFLKLNKESGMTESKMNAKAFLDIARNQAKEEMSLDKAVMTSSKAYANQQLDLQKAKVIAWVDIEAAKWAMDGTARLAASYGLDPAGWALLAAAGAATVGIRQVASQVKLAKGGIVMPTAGGTVATIGEAGSAEAVIPLDSPRAEAMLGGSNGDNSGPVVINVMVDSAQLAKVVYKNIRELQRSGQIAGGL